MKALFRFLVLLVAVCLLGSCAQVPDTHPDEVLVLLTKCRDFLSFCIFLLNQDPPVYYNHIADRYYYAMLCLARIIAGPSSLSSIEKKGHHERVWAACPSSVQVLYGNKLKKLRVKCDYGLKPNDLKSIRFRGELNNILAQTEVFDSLKKSVESVYEDVSSRQNFVEDCDALKEAIVSEVETIREKISNP